MLTISHRMPVYILNALYLAPLTIWTYLNYGRPMPPGSKQKPSCHQKEDIESRGESGPECHQDQGGHDIGMSPKGIEGSDHDMSSHCHMHHGSSDRPIFATITVAVCHCGAGCLLGDIVGEWLLYGAGITIQGRSLWAEYLIGKLSSLSFFVSLKQERILTLNTC